MSDHAFRILVGFDDSSTSERALRLAFDQAGHHPLSQVHVIKVLPNVSDTLRASSSVDLWGAGATLTSPLNEETGVDARKVLQRTVEAIFEDWAQTRLNFIGRISVHTRIDVPVDGILSLAEELDVDLIVVGTHGRKGFTRLLFGSIAEAVIRDAPCPVLVAQHRDRLEADQPEARAS